MENNVKTSNHIDYFLFDLYLKDLSHISLLEAQLDFLLIKFVSPYTCATLEWKKWKRKDTGIVVNYILS